MPYITAELEVAARLTRSILVTKAPEQRGRIRDYSVGQIAVIQHHPSKGASVDLARLRYIGEEKWEPLD